MSAPATPADTSTSTGRPVVVKISRKIIPAHMSYDEFVQVYRQLLDWLRSVRLKDPKHPAYALEAHFLNDHTKLQKYLKVSAGKLAAAQKRLLMALERMRRLALHGSPDAGNISSPEFDAEGQGTPASASASTSKSPVKSEQSGPNMMLDDTKGCLSATAANIKSEPDDEREPSANPMSDTPSLTSTDTAPSASQSPASDVLRVKAEEIDASAISTEPEEDDTGAASLLMLRRRAENAQAKLPANLNALPRKDPTKSDSRPMTAMPSAYYRSPYVLSHSPQTATTATPSHRRLPSSSAEQRSLGSPIRTKSGSRLARLTLDAPPVTAHVRTPSGLPSALQDLRLSRAQDGTRTASLAEHGHRYAPPSLHGTQQSPRIIIPPPTFSPTQRRRSSFRRGSDTAASQGPISAKGLRFIAPPPQHKIAPHYPLYTPSHWQDPRARRYSDETPAVPLPQEYGLRTPVRESFVRTPSTPGKRAMAYEPCGNVDTRRSSAASSPEDKGRRVILPPRALSHTGPPVQHVQGKRTHEAMEDRGLRFILPAGYRGSPDEMDGPGLKRTRRGSGSPSGSSDGSNHEAQRRYIVPSSRRSVVAQSQSSSSVPSHRPAGYPPRRSPPPVPVEQRRSPSPPRKPAPATSGGEKSILSQLLTEISNRDEGRTDDAAARALEEVAATLSLVAQRLRSH